MTGQPGKPPEERFRPETPREERLFEHAKGNWYADEWSKISGELEKDKNLVSRYEEFLSDAIKKETVGEIETPTGIEKIPTKQDKIEKQKIDEWSLENLNKINQSDREKLMKVFFGFILLGEIISDKLVADHRNEEAEALNLNIRDLAEKFDGKEPPGLLIELKNLFKKYNVPDSILNIHTLSEMARDFEEGLGNR